MYIGRQMYDESGLKLLPEVELCFGPSGQWADLAKLLILYSEHDPYDAWRLWYRAIATQLSFEQMLGLAGQMITIATLRLSNGFGSFPAPPSQDALSYYLRGSRVLSAAVRRLAAWQFDGEGKYSSFYVLQDKMQLETAQTIYRLPWDMPCNCPEDLSEILGQCCDALGRYGVGPVGNREFTINVPLPYATCTTQVSFQFYATDANWMLHGEIPCPDIGVPEIWVKSSDHDDAPELISFGGGNLAGLVARLGLHPTMTRTQIKDILYTRVAYSSHPHKR